MATTSGTAILGEGALGLSLAYRLTTAGERVVVMERGAEAGSLAAGFYVSTFGPWLVRFYHHIQDKIFQLSRLSVLVLPRELMRDLAG